MFVLLACELDIIDEFTSYIIPRGVSIRDKEVFKLIKAYNDKANRKLLKEELKKNKQLAKKCFDAFESFKISYRLSRNQKKC